jgi:hypothetical protein
MNTTQSMRGDSHAAFHLNDDQFSEYLMGEEPTAEVTAHLAQCEACREEMAGFDLSVDSFNQTTLAWSESRPAAGLGSAGGQRWLQRPIFAASAWALAACMMLAAGVFAVLHHEQSERPADIASIASPTMGNTVQDSEAQIAQDNKLLMDVDMALRSGDRSPVQEYGLEAVSTARRSARGVSRVQ